MGAASFARGVGLTAYNLGVRGERPRLIAARWHREACSRLRPGTQTRLVLSFGANDTAEVNGEPRVASAQTIAALARILDTASAERFGVIVVGPPPAGDDAQHQRLRALSHEFDACCRSRSVPFIEIAHRLGRDSAVVREARNGDGAHPAAAGYCELAELIIGGGMLEWLEG